MIMILLEALKTEFREFCSGYFSLRVIRNIFEALGEPEPATSDETNGQRRGLVNAYYSQMEWSKVDALETMCNVLTSGLRVGCSSEEERVRFREMCARQGLSIEDDGYTIVSPVENSVAETIMAEVKNLMFASTGKKPKLVLRDAITNQLEIVKHSQNCLVYDNNIGPNGLLWKELVIWWQDQSNIESMIDSERSLYKRLFASLDSPPEKVLFKTYFSIFRPILKDDLPALVPQIWLHYDPYTAKQLGGVVNLFRQRMDFLLLLDQGRKVVVEVDGKQHYAEGNIASPRLYSDMVSEDRRLKLSGYDIFRFGGYELMGKDGEELVHDFFQRLLNIH